MASDARFLVSVLMGARDDWEVMEHTSKMLTELSIAHEVRVLSSHRAPHATTEYVQNLAGRGIEVVIAAAGGAAHLAGVVAAHTHLPVLGVPLPSASLQGLDSLLSTVQMPAGVPVATFAIGKPGAINAALFAAAQLARRYAGIEASLLEFRRAQTEKTLSVGDPRGSK
jgi:5-(carboxyamino)imidazole ribonucleotide mutase